MSQVKIVNVTKQFGEVKAVNCFNEIIRDGEFVSILGPSGCGKTTMLRMIAGFEKASEGEIYIGNSVVSSDKNKVFVPPEKRGIGMVFQSYAVWPHMNVFDNVAYPLKIKKIPKYEIKKKVNKALETVHLDQYADRFPSQLSGGQQQRVALGRSLVGEPELLLLDEPLSNLDAKLRESMRFEIKEIQKKLNMTVIYVTHDQAEAMAMSDRIIVMNKGIIQQVDVPNNIYEKPANEFVADFIGKVNFIKGISNCEEVQLTELECNIKYHSVINDNVILAVRPENISLNKEKGDIKGNIIGKFYLGDTVDYRINVNKKVIRAIIRADIDSNFKEGEEISLTLNKIILFKDNGQCSDIKITT
ncbi:ABC transporter ATP-binding protein [Clostridium lundense]|uniref:ABC transporter ATP-binding protein n=1 Tax=Clostridium lundense TaxID=319475 RepID=UPI0004852466|nr:ABC transporter ATP-binding protein [Clostridium lundense]